jgi:hypothetical protein
MRFLVMHKVDATMESGQPPSQAIIKGMGAFIGESLKSGVFLDGAGLHKSARRARVRSSGGACVVEDGPYAGGNELVASLAMIKTRSKAEAIEHARRLAAALGDCEMEVGSVVEGWDLTGAPKPAHIEHERFLILLKGDAAYESGAAARGASARGAVDAIAADMKREGVLIAAESLEQSAKGKRLPSAAASKEKRTWIDGPFAESKELIAGYSLLALPSLAEALAWADRYAGILHGNEVDVRVVREPSGFAL